MMAEARVTLKNQGAASQTEINRLSKYHEQMKPGSVQFSSRSLTLTEGFV